jgi:hypothetical protein
VGSFSIWHWLIVLFFFSPAIIGLAVMGPQKSVTLTHPQTGVAKHGYIGWCWPCYLFGWFVPFFRGEIGVGLIHLLLATVTLGISHLIMPFLYNKHHMDRLLQAGWKKNDAAPKTYPPVHTPATADAQWATSPQRNPAIHKPMTNESVNQVPIPLTDAEVNAMYASVAEEIESGNKDRGLWTRLYAECDGDENRIKVQYIKKRAAQLIEVEREERRVANEAAREAAQRKSAEIRAQEDIAEAERLRKHKLELDARLAAEAALNQRRFEEKEKDALSRLPITKVGSCYRVNRTNYYDLDSAIACAEADQSSKQFVSAKTKGPSVWMVIPPINQRPEK